MAGVYRIVTAASMVLVAGMAWAIESGWQGPPVVGSLHAYSRDSPKDKITTKIYVNREGFRAEMPLPIGRMISILNSKVGKCWYIDEGKKTYMELSANSTKSDCPSFMGEAMDEGAEASLSSVAVPCEGYAKKSAVGTDTVAGRAVEKWSCSGGESGATATQWFDRKFPLLLREETSAGDVMEFYEVSETSFAATLLELPKGVKRISAEEFRKAIFGGILPPAIPAN